MEIRVSGKNMNVGEAFSIHIQERLNTIADKYFSRSIDAHTNVSKEGHLYRIDVSMHANQGINLQSRGEGSEPYGAFEVAAEKVEKQLRRYKRRLKNHHHNGPSEAEIERMAYTVLAPEPEAEDEGVNEEGRDDQPIIIAETHKEVPTVVVGDAVMLMDLADTNAFLFRNSKTKTLEVVYKRPDGNIGWISTD
ncbi:ribosome-associated translation inhibitor RaiA [Temperatibacter marinus]|uniref:Ribosome hibernation promoting factor n=1 Tax=Temperatibacter marinus TaxID=1456591 RepID=A0AA52EJL9_9PROT|nr:ribosome-associated translation inhibitor RaiA [Temperatibacter marinus]WND03732.1 ribosome-associated translation inhibitor RaiA [Temperatibacter marinus]